MCAVRCLSRALVQSFSITTVRHAVDVIVFFSARLLASISSNRIHRFDHRTLYEYVYIYYRRYRSRHVHEMYART